MPSTRLKGLKSPYNKACNWFRDGTGLSYMKAIYSQHSSDLIPHLFGRTTWRHWWKGSWLGWPEHPQLLIWVTIWLVGAADWDANLNLLFCQYTLLPRHNAYIYGVPDASQQILNFNMQFLVIELYFIPINFSCMSFDDFPLTFQWKTK